MSSFSTRVFALGIAAFAGGFGYALGHRTAWLERTAVAAEQNSSNQASATSGDVDKRYVQADLQLAQATLDYAQAVNRGSRESTGAEIYHPAAIEEIRTKIDALKAWQMQLANGARPNLIQIYIRKQKDEVKLAGIRLQEVQRLRRLGSADASTEKRAELAVKVAQIRLEKVQSPEFAQSPTTQVWWKIAGLQEEVADLRFRLQGLK